MFKILLVEDDPNLGFMTQEHLEEKGYSVVRELDGKAALLRFKTCKFDICIVDIMMPLMDGFQLVEEIKKLNHEIPVVFLTAKSLKEDKIKGFKLGADDYLTKPFSIEELYFRIEAIKKRVYGSGPHVMKKYNLGVFEIDFDNRRLAEGSKNIKLTAKETELLKLFCENINKSVSREQFLIRVWKENSYYNARSMDVYISKIRKLLAIDARIEILNEHGVGFKMIFNEND